MKLHFDSNLDYQLNAINTVVDVFQGQPDDQPWVGSTRIYLDDDQESLFEKASAKGN